MNKPVSSGYCVTDPTALSKIEREKDDRVDILSIPALMKRSVENYGNHTALMYKEASSEKWNGISYKEYLARVEKMAKVFIKLGLERHGSVAILAFNSVEWFVSELAAIHAGGMIAGIYTTNSADSCLHILETSKSSIVVVDDDKQLAKILEIREKLPHLKAIVQTLAPFSPNLKQSDGYWRWSELEAMDTDNVEDEYKKREAEIVPNECCCLIYTSGTVGKSKGVMLSHDNINFAAQAVHFDFDFQKGNEKFVSYLPLSHVAAQIAEIFLTLSLGATVYFADKDAMRGSLVKTLLSVKPTFFFGVPRVYEKIQEKMATIAAQSGALKSLIGSWAKRVTLQHNVNLMTGYQAESLQFKLAEKLVISKVKRALGFENCRNFASGAAPMRADTKKYFMSLNIKIRDAFGMSETSGPHCVCPTNIKSFDTAGRALAGAKSKIINPDERGHGELCAKGRHIFMGYLNEVEKTLEALDEDGWLHTGDVAYMDNDDCVFITGRIKELLITAGGENIAPVPIESLLKAECAAIANAFLIGDKRKYLTVLLTLKTEVNHDTAPIDDLAGETLHWLEGMDLKYTKLSEILAAGPDPKVLQSLQEAVNRANQSSVSNAQKIQKFAILPCDFSIPTGELGPTLKIKRNVVVEKYREIIEKFYN